MDDQRPRSLADTPKRGAVIYDDTAAATPLDKAAGYDLATCDTKHKRMIAYQAQRIDQIGFGLEAATREIAHLRALGAALDERVVELETMIREWSAGR